LIDILMTAHKFVNYIALITFKSIKFWEKRSSFKSS